MRFLKFLQREAEAYSHRLLIVALLSGLVSGLLVVTMISSAGMLYRSPEQARMFILLILCMVLYVLFRKYLHDQASLIVAGIVRQIRLRIADKVRHAELSSFEAIGPDPIYAALTEDTHTLSEAANFTIGALSSAVQVVLSLATIAVLSLPSFLLIATFISVGATIYVRNARALRPELHRAVEEEHRFFRMLSHLLYGFRELKVDAEKSAALANEELKPLASRTEQLRIHALRKFNRNIVFGESFLYGLVAVLIFVTPAITGNANDVRFLQVLAILLFMASPVDEVVGAVPAMERASVAVERIEQLEENLGTGLPVPDAPPRAHAPFEALRCEGLSFRYPEQPGQHPFSLGPIDLEVRRGEIVFLIGGNGSGKSTLIKLLCGLYPATGGSLWINGTCVTEQMVQQYRSRFAIILQDFHLFDRIFRKPPLDRARIDELLTAFDLAGVTGVREDGWFENTRLSTGQKKRLALMVAELEERDVLIFDEWAADQDPEFRRYFYLVLLRSLAARGKTVIAATHDDHYFHIADRVLKMSDGRLEPYQSRPVEHHG